MKKRKLLFWGGQFVMFVMWTAFFTVMSGSLWFGFAGAAILNVLMFITDKAFNAVELEDK